VGTRAEGVTVWLGNVQVPTKDFAVEYHQRADQPIVIRAQSKTRLEFYVQHSATTGAATLAKPKAPPPAPKPPCDAENELDLGTDANGDGDNVVALAHFEAAYACKPGNHHIIELAFMSACNGANLPKAQTYWHKLSSDQQKMLLPICIHTHITRDQLDAGSCDADKELNLGTQANGQGDHAGALAHYETAYACAPAKEHTVELAFMAACNGANVAKARVYWRKMPAEQQTKYLSWCVHSHISRAQLDAK
jgi:hypothetical protein